MGLLDDAIREHLDLKRRRGADPAEVERLEREALGPVRRNTGQTAVDDGDPELTADSAYDEPGAPMLADEADAEAAYVAGGGLEPALEPWDLDDERTRVVAPRADDPPAAATDTAEEEDPSAGHPPASMADPASGTPPPLAFINQEDEDDAPLADAPAEPEDHHGETTEYDVERALAEEQAGHRPVTPGVPGDEDEDVLEETPEFLQDAPEHDRLWFEQRPPRDFDFDG